MAEENRSGQQRNLFQTETEKRPKFAPKKTGGGDQMAEENKGKKKGNLPRRKLAVRT